MGLDDLDGFLTSLDDLTDGRLTNQLYDGDFTEEWRDVVAGVDWLANAKARSRGAEAYEIEDVLWCLPTLQLVPYTANQMWWLSGEPIEDDLVLTEDDDATAIRHIRAGLFRGVDGGASIPALVPEQAFRAIESSLFELLVPHADIETVLVSIGELHYRLHNASDVVDYLDTA